MEGWIRNESSCRLLLLQILMMLLHLPLKISHYYSDWNLFGGKWSRDLWKSADN